MPFEISTVLLCVKPFLLSNEINLKPHFASAKFSCTSVLSVLFIIELCHRPLCEEIRNMNKHQALGKLMNIAKSLKKTPNKPSKSKNMTRKQNLQICQVLLIFSCFLISFHGTFFSLSRRGITYFLN